MFLYGPLVFLFRLYVKSPMKSSRTWNVKKIDPILKEKAEEYIKDLIQRYKRRPIDAKNIQPFSTAHPKEKR